MGYNIEKAKEYAIKSKALGKGELLLTYIESGDRVVLERVLDTESKNRLIIPDFITEYKYTDTGLGFKISPLAWCRNREIMINNREDRLLDASDLMCNIRSDRVKIRFARPENIINIAGMVANSPYCKVIEIENLDTTRIVSAAEIFAGDIALEEVRLSGNIGWIEDTDIEDMFYGCDSIKSIKISTNNYLGYRELKNRTSKYKKYIDIQYNGPNIRL